MDAMTPPSLVWFRDDLRLADNPALRAAADRDEPVIGVYVLDEASPGVRPLGGAARWWLHHSLSELDERLRVYVALASHELEPAIALGDERSAREIFDVLAVVLSLSRADIPSRRQGVVGGLDLGECRGVAEARHVGVPVERGVRLDPTPRMERPRDAGDVLA